MPLRIRSAAFAGCAWVLLSAAPAGADTLDALADRCTAAPDSAECEPLAAWCADDRFVEAGPARCKWAHGRPARAPRPSELRPDCARRADTGPCAVIREACAAPEIPVSLGSACADARRWTEPEPPPPPPRQASRDDDETERIVVAPRGPLLGTTLGAGVWSIGGNWVPGVRVGFALPLVPSIRLGVDAEFVSDLSFRGPYLRGQGELAWSTGLFAGLGLGLHAGGGWDGSLGTSGVVSVPGAPWVHVGGRLSASLGGCGELCDAADDFSLRFGVDGTARFVLGTGGRATADRASQFDDLLADVWLRLPVGSGLTISVRFASLSSAGTAGWTGLFLSGPL